MPFVNRARLPFLLRNAQFPTTRNVFRKANGEVITLSVRTRKTYELITDWMPEILHQQLIIALSHDNVTIEGDKYFGGVALDGEYTITYNNEVPSFKLGQANARVDVTPFNESNDNCSTCEELSQLQLVDDTGIEMEEGEVATLEVFDNDSICCFPITVDLVWFDTTYFSSVTIDDAGVITFTVKNPVANSNPGVPLATYRVTCPNGSYDEADVYGTIIGGTEVPCPAPFYLTHTHTPQTEISYESDIIEWGGTGTWDWLLYECDDLGTPIQSGETTDNELVFLDLSPGTCYTISIRGDCGDGLFSDYESLEFTTPSPETSCGRFAVSCDDGTSNRESYNYSFYDCNGILRSYSLVNTQTTFRCMLMDAFNEPVYFASELGFVTWVYVGEC